LSLNPGRFECKKELIPVANFFFLPKDLYISTTLGGVEVVKMS